MNDDIAITKSTEYQAVDVNFLSVFYAKDLSTIESDGLLGLSPKSDYVSQGNTEPMHLLVNEMKVDGIISKAMFGLYLTDTASQSKIHFGGYDESIV